MYTERQQQLLKHLSEVRFARVDQLADYFNVSIETIRRDLIDLERDGSILRTRGGAAFNQSRAKEIEFDRKLGADLPQKEAASQLVCDHIDDGDALVISNGASNMAAARVLARQKNRLTVVTNSMEIAEIFNSNASITVYVTGGRQRKHNRSLVGSVCVECLDKFRVDKALINVDGLSIRDGITQFNVEEAATLKKMLEISNTRMILTQSSKFEAVAFNRICSVGAIHYVFTDWDLPAKTAQEWLEQGVKVISAKREK